MIDDLLEEIDRMISRIIIVNAYSVTGSSTILNRCLQLLDL